MASSPEVQEIKDKIDIADFVGEYLRLVPAGTGIFKAACPFHNEKTPSMIVSPARQSFHCFGCGAGGDVFEFLMKIENIEFPEALKVLAQKAGVTLSRQNREQLSHKNRLYDLCELTARYWHKILLDSPKAQEVRDYLSNRGINGDSIEQFQIGYSVDDWSNLLDFLKKKGYSEQEIFSAGLSIKKDRGPGYYDRFRHRLMFPIIDHHGRTVGFGGRALKKDEPAKYINSPQTEIYNKSEVLYGLYWAKDAIRKADECILVEGYMDVIPSHQAGVKNVVSISGTALTDQQLKNLKRYTSNLALSLDMDDAGMRAALRSIEIALQSEINVKVITLPQGKDPGECATKNPDDWKEAIKNAESVMEYFFSRAVKGRDINSPEDKKEIARFLITKIIQLGNPVERDHWLRQLSSRLNVSEEAVRELAMIAGKLIQNAPRAAVGASGASAEGSNSASNRPLGATSPEKAINGRDLTMFRRVLAIIWTYPEYLAILPETLSPEMIPDEVLGGIYKELILFYTKNNELFTLGAGEHMESQIFDQFLTQVKAQNANPPVQSHTASLESLRQAVSILEQSYLLAQKDFFELSAKDAKIELDNMLKLLKSGYLKSKISRLKFDLEQAEKRADKSEAEKIYLELNDLVKQISAV